MRSPVSGRRSHDVRRDARRSLQRAPRRALTPRRTARRHRHGRARSDPIQPRSARRRRGRGDRVHLVLAERDWHHELAAVVQQAREVGYILRDVDHLRGGGRDVRDRHGMDVQLTARGPAVARRGLEERNVTASRHSCRVARRPTIITAWRILLARIGRPTYAEFAKRRMLAASAGSASSAGRARRAGIPRHRSASARAGRSGRAPATGHNGESPRRPAPPPRRGGCDASPVIRIASWPSVARSNAVIRRSRTRIFGASSGSFRLCA